MLPITAQLVLGAGTVRSSEGGALSVAAHSDADGVCMLFFSAIFPAILLSTLVQLGPVPPVVRNTSGSKDAFSVSRTLS